ncbi:hypothetical protein [Micromonospora sp. NPDC000668]|uniref:hypothetical protein n=1 Tax=Micromonospora sp. NPDC000668 TaxID=3364219 RepID=UPI00367B6A76
MVLDADNLAWDYPLPDDLAALAEKERTASIQTLTRQIVQADGYGSAIRVILPIPLDTGDLITLGVWLAITPAAEWDRVLSAAQAGGDAWSGTTFAGVLLNAVEPWPDVYLAEAVAVVPGPNKVPRITDSASELLRRVLTGPWSHKEVVGARA